MIPTWISISVAAYFCMALSQLIDKVLLRVAFREVKAFVFLIAALNVFVLILLPLGVRLPSASLLILSLVGGALFIFALIPFLSALQSDDASRIIPFVGAVIPVVTLLAETVFLKTPLSRTDLMAFALLVVGSMLLTHSPSSNRRQPWLSILQAFLGALLFSASFVITKHIYNEMSFVNGFFWMRMGGVIVGLILLCYSSVRRGVREFFRKNKFVVQTGYFATQGLNGFGFILQNYAISLASVGLVNALQGSQYLFLVAFIAVAGYYKPALLQEKFSMAVIIEKGVAILTIIAGIVVLALW